MNDLFSEPWISLEQAKATLRENIDRGIICPCCGQYAREYRRKLNSGMAITLIRLYRVSFNTPDRWIHVKDFLRELKYHNGHDWTLLRHWGLLEECPASPKKEKKSGGYWRITQFGKLFVYDPTTTVNSRIIIFNNILIRLEGDPITIRQALTSKFNYEELMQS